MPSISSTFANTTTADDFFMESTGNGSQLETSDDEDDVQLAGLINETDYRVIIFALGVTGFIISFVGLVTNSVNVLVFVRIGLRDGVSVSFLGLTLADLIRSVSNMFILLALALKSVENWHPDKHVYPIDPFAINVLTANISKALYVVTTLNTTFISVVRCLCITFPLQFRHILTPVTATVVNILFHMSAIALYTPLFVLQTYRVTYSKDLQGNRYSLKSPPGRALAKYVIDIISQTILPSCTLVILLICALIMSSSLERVAAFRKAKQDLDVEAVEEKDAATKVGQQKKLSGKELQALLQVTFICLAYIFFNTPMVTMRLAATFVPGFSALKHNRYYRMYFVCKMFRRMLEQINTSVNLIIYCKYNTKFREVLTSRARLFGGKK